jgi:hypothetical protein
MQANKKIGNYVLGEDGVLTNPPAGDPLPHGEIYNSNEIAYLNPDMESAAKVEEDINNLYMSDSATTDEIKKMRYSYNALSLAQKARVHNEYLLAEMEINAEIVYDYDSIYSSPDVETSSDNGSKKGTNYVFEISQSAPVLTVVVRYPTDEEGKPRSTNVTLTSPDGTINDLTSDMTQMRTSAMNIFLTWTDTYVQLDVSHAEYGKWSINTDNVCSFIPKEYAGSKIDIEAIPEDDVEDKTEEKAEPVEESEEEGIDIGLIMGIVMIVIIIAIMIYTMKKPADKTLFGSKKKKNTAPVQKEQNTAMSDEEEYLQMKAQLTAEFDNYIEKRQNTQADTAPATNTAPPPQSFTPLYVTENDPFMTGGQEEDEVTDSIEEYDAAFTTSQNQDDDWIDDAFD